MSASVFIPPPVSKRTFADFESTLMTAARARHLPMAGSFELTYRCNFDCVHCFQQDVRAQAELTGDRWIQLVDEIADAGCLWLTLTGGEAMMHPGFAAIYERAIRRGLLVTVFSNGSTLTEKNVALLTRLPPRNLEVTLYGSSAETYARSTGKARNFDLAVGGVDRALAAGLRVQLKTMAFDETAQDLEAIRAFAAERGQAFRYDTTIHATLAGGDAPLQHRLRPEDTVALEAKDSFAFDAVRARHGSAEASGSDRVYRCGAGRFSFSVAPDGQLQLCTLVRSLRFNLATVPFVAAWDALGTEVQRRYSSERRRCNGCELRHMCGTCPGIAELEQGDAEAAIDHLCETTHLRAEAIFGRAFVPPGKHANDRRSLLRVLPAEQAPPRPRELI